MLGDDALVAAQRLTEWTTHAPELEEEVAIANVALDLLGQTRLLFARAAAADASLVPFVTPTSPAPPEDALAFFRDENDFRNVRIVEIENGDFAQSMAWLTILSAWRLALFARLRDSRDPVLAAVARKGVKELTYHRDYAARWMVTFGCGTDESRRRLIEGLERIWPYVNELFEPTADELELAAVGVGVDPRTVRMEFDDVLEHIFSAAEVDAPETATAGRLGGRAGRDGAHTEFLGHLLAEMQSVARAHPEASW